jgi:hypothetical protein
MLRTLLTRTPVKRLVRGVPVMRLLAVADVAILAKEHLARLDSAQRSRLLALVRKAHGRPSALSDDERDELAGLLARLEPRRLFADAADKVSPVPLPGRLLRGRGPASGERDANARSRKPGD